MHNRDVASFTWQIWLLYVIVFPPWNTVACQKNVHGQDSVAEEQVFIWVEDTNTEKYSGKEL